MENKSAGNGFLILSIAGILGKLLSALYVPLLSNILGTDGYGIYTVGYDIFVFLIAVTSLGVQPAVTKVVTEYRAIGNYKDSLRAMKIARRTFTLISIVIAGIFMLLAYPIANIINRPDSALTFIFLAPALVFATIIAAYRGYIQGTERMESLAISQVLEQLVNVVISLIFAFMLLKVTESYDWGSAGGTIGTSLGAIVAIIYIIYIFEKQGYEEEAEEKQEPQVKRIHKKRIVKKLFSYAIPICLVAGVQNFAGVIDSITLGIGLEKAGLGENIDYLAAHLNYYKTLVYVPLAIVTALATAIFPKIIKAFVLKDKKDLRRQTSYAFRITYIIVIPATIGLALLSKEIYRFLFNTNEWYGLLTYGSILLVFMSITTIQNIILQGINKLYLIIFSASAGVVVKIILNIILVPKISITGAMIATIISYIIPTVINHKKIQGFFKVRVPIIRQSIIPIIGSIAMALIILLGKIPVNKLMENLGSGRMITGIGTFILIGLGGIAYLYVMVYLGGIKRQDLDLISTKLFRFLPRAIRRKLS